MRVAIITDQHFGARSDSVVFLDFFQKFYDDVFFPKLVEEKIDTVLILGDTFDRRKYVNFYSLQRAKEMFFDKLAAMNIQVHMLAGNHDTYYKNTNDVNSPDLLLREYNNINVIDHPATIYVDKMPICMMPWICPENYQDSIDTLKDTQAEICMGHFEIAGFAMYRGMESHEGLSMDMFEKYEQVFSGHYHTRSQKGNITYVGTPYEMSWQDYNDPKGYHLFDTEDRSLQFTQNPNTIFVRLDYDDTKELLDLNTADLSDRFIKLVVTNKTDLYKFDNYVQKLYSKGAYEIKIVEDLSEFNDGEIGEEIDLEDTMDVLSNYIDSIETDADKEKIKSFMKSLYVEAVNIEVID